MEPNPSPTCRIAICDDVADFRRVVSFLFDLEPDMEVVGHADDGQQAIELVGAQQVDVLLLDVAMPVMDGIEALPQILERSPTTKVIMLTGFGSERIRRRVDELGARAYLEKGVPPNELVATVRQVHGTAR